MPILQAQLPRYPVQALTTLFHLQGEMEPVGPILDFLNDVNRQYLPFLNATVCSLVPGPLGKMTHSHLVVPSTEIVALYFDDPNARASIQHLRRAERCIAYLPGLVCRAEFHLGTDSRWQDMLSLLHGDYFAVTCALAFPLVALPGPFPQQADMLILNRLHVRMLHPDQSQSGTT